MTRDEALKLLWVQCEEDKNTAEVPRGSNRGKRVEQMLRNTGLGGGYPWCAAYVATMGIEAFGAAYPVPHTADCDAILAWARKKGVLYKSDPKPGDIFLRMKNSYDATHTGFIHHNLGGGMSKCWEGNTNNGGGREGDAVHFRSRVTENLWYVRFLDVMDLDRVGAPAAAPVVQAPPIKVLFPTGPFPVVQMHDFEKDSDGFRACVPIRAACAVLEGVSLEATDAVEWDAIRKTTTVNGKALSWVYVDPANGGTGYAPVRDVAEAMGFKVALETQADGKKAIVVSK